MKEKFGYIFTKHDKRVIALLLVMTVIGSVLELLGVTIFLPFVNVIMYPNYVERNWFLNWVYVKGGFTSIKGFEIFLCFVIIGIYIVKNLYLVWQKNVTYKFSFRILI